MDQQRSPPPAAIAIASEGDDRVPVIAGTTVSVGDVVRVCHDTTIDQGLAKLAVPGLDRAALEPVLTYCAEQRCATDLATCNGCRRRTEADGISSMDDLVRRHRKIVVADGAITLSGQGIRDLEVASLDHLARTWAGDEQWFLARRVLRKLWHGVRRAHIQGMPVAAEGQTPAVLLMAPQLAENIGMVARAMGNFGLDSLRLIAPRDGWPNEKARIAASGANYVIDDATAYPTLADAMGDLNWVCATTARQRDMRKPVLTPLEAIAEIRRRIIRGERCGMLFGRERNGLESAEIADADAIVMIPVNSRFASLNLAQAVLILGYEWARSGTDATLGRVTTYETPVEPGLRLGDDRPATKAELTGFFEHLETELDRLGFFNPAHRRETFVRNMRTLFTRAAPTDQEVRTLRGIVATLAYGKGQSRKPP